MSFAVRCPACSRVTELTGITAGDRVYCPYCGTPSHATGTGSIEDVVGDMMAEMMADYSPPHRWGRGWVGRLTACNLLLCTIAILLAAGFLERKSIRKVAAPPIIPPQTANDPNLLPPLNPFTPPDSLDDALRLLNDNDVHRREAAVDWLARAPVEDRRRDEVSQALIPILEARDWQLHHPASVALAVWSTRDSANRLYSLAQREAVPGWSAALESLALIRDERAGPLAASYLPNIFKRFVASRTLELLGPAAESEVIPYLQSGDLGLRRDVARLLGEVGTAKSLAPLAAAGQSDKRLLPDVEAAASAIRRRQ